MKISYRTPSFIKKFIHHYGILSVHHRRNIAAPYHPWLNVICRPKRNRGVIFLNQINQHRNTLTAGLERDELLLATMNPPSAKTKSKVKVPSIFATACVLQTAAMNRKRDSAIWCMPKNAKNCRKNLSYKGRNVSMKEP